MTFRVTDGCKAEGPEMGVTKAGLGDCSAASSRGACREGALAMELGRPGGVLLRLCWGSGSQRGCGECPERGQRMPRQSLM